MKATEMNAYRLTSLDEPTDAMLATLMREVTEEAKRKADAATERLFKQLDERTAARRKEWAQKHPNHDSNRQQ